MMNRKINLKNLELATPKDLGEISSKKILNYANKTLNTNCKTFNQLKKVEVRGTFPLKNLTKNEILLMLGNVYNQQVEYNKYQAKQQKKLIKNSFLSTIGNTIDDYKIKEEYTKKINQKIIKIALTRKLIAKRYKIEPVESAFKSYYLYNIPSYDSWINKKMNRIVSKLTDNSSYVEMDLKDVRKYSIEISNYSLPTIVKNLNKFQTVRTYVVINFKCFNTNNNEEFNSRFNLGRIDFNRFKEFYNYLVAGIKRGYEVTNSKDYVICYGFNNIELNILRYIPLSGSSYATLPDFIANSKSIINIKNTDNFCFKWCCIASRHLPEKDADRVTKYRQYENEFKCEDAEFPMSIKNIHKFENNNNVTINVFTVDEKTKVPIYISKNKSDEVINLFYYENHYSLIKNFQRFVGGDHNYVCCRCFKSYHNKEYFDKHVIVCTELNANGSYETTPKKGTTTKFNNYKKQKRLPVVLYADFESCLENTNSITKNGKETQKDYITAKHKANSFRLKIVSDVELDIPLDYLYHGVDASVEFIKLIVRLDKIITEKLNFYNNLYKFPKLTRQEEIKYKTEENCRFCCKKLENDRVRDHCHFTGKYQGAAHKLCNIKAIQMIKGKNQEQGNIEIPLFFHNANYDIRCFINAFSELNTEEGIKNISGVPCNIEFYKCLQLNNICIKDSYAHLSSSLDKLIKNLPEDKKHYLHTIAGDNETRQKMVNKKGFYPYEFVDNQEKLNTPIENIKREHFNSKLTLSKLSDEDWEHIQSVIKEFNIKTLKEFHDLYLNIDVYGLADVFEYHRELSMATYGLDPAHYIGLPALSWDAGLKETHIELENIDSIDKINFFELMKRGGISVISKRYAKANNQYLPDYNPEIEKSFILQLDCNNLYGWAMMQKLPVGKFEWIKPEDFNIEMYDKEGDIGYVLEVDLKYPEELHDLHNDYPLAPEHLEINKCKKLTPNLRDKRNYYVNIDNLIYYISKGLILEKIHRIIKFERKAWLKQYIDKNSAMRQKAANDFEKDFYKLMNNAFYGKTMENERGRVNIQFCMNEKSFLKHTNSPLFADQILIIKTDGLTLVKTHKKTVKLQKPIYTGAIVLEMSKLLMFQFHYDTMKVAYPQAEMCKTDTDSLLYYIKTDDVYLDMHQTKTLQEQIEFSNYPKNHLLYNTDRKKVPGFFQDECVDGKFVIISEYVGLRAKSYVNQLYNPEEKSYADKKKSKGVASIHIKKNINFGDYKQCLFDKTEKRLENIVSFRSIGLQTYTVSMKKIALSGKDDKRVIFENGIDTYAHGHYKSQPKMVM